MGEQLNRLDISTLADELLAKLAADKAFEAGDPSMRAELDRERRLRDEQQLAADAAARIRHAYERCLAKLPPKLRREVEDLGVDAAAWPATAAALNWWRKGETRALLIRGGVGGGKSSAAAAVLRECSQQCAQTGAHAEPMSWLRSGDFVSAVLHSYDERAPRLGSRLVVIDDVGLETKPEFDLALCTFLDDNEQRLIMTTNLTKDAFAERYGVRVVDRLRELGTAITIKGASRRRQSSEF